MLYVETQEAERKFLQSLITLKVRDHGVTWKGWTCGYIQLCSLSDDGQEFIKTKRKFLYF